MTTKTVTFRMAIFFIIMAVMVLSVAYLSVDKEEPEAVQSPVASVTPRPGIFRPSQQNVQPTGRIEEPRKPEQNPTPTPSPTTSTTEPQPAPSPTPPAPTPPLINIPCLPLVNC
jgi:hypothetical protein